MTPSIFIARILGPLLGMIGIGLLLESETFRAMAAEFLHSSALIYLTGIITLAVGLAILNVHHLWERDWRVVITIFGWLFLIGGIFRLLAPSLVRRMGESFIAHQRWPIAGAVVTLALGAFLTVVGYQDVWGGGRGRQSHRSSAARSTRPASRSAKRPRRKAGEARPPH
jgi:hypothetical protein